MLMPFTDLESRKDQVELSQESLGVFEHALGEPSQPGCEVPWLVVLRTPIGDLDFRAKAILKPHCGNIVEV